jgi:Zn-dependent M28 family amino/carboxypeptidase
MLAEISPDRLKATVDRLAAFGTRHTLSRTDSETRGIGAARRWIAAELQRIAAASGRTGEAAMTVELETFAQPPDGKRVPTAVDIVDVVATLPGAAAEARPRRYYVVAHYDSRATDPLDAAADAPGANDDASGVALVLELARIMSARRFDATVVFLATAGEEQGLLGARLHAQKARAEGRDVRAVLSDDIVGDPLGEPGHVRVFSEGLPVAATAEQIAEIRRLGAESDSPSRELARFVAEVARLHGLAVEPKLVFRGDRFLRGGDHLAFNDLGFPAVRFTTVREDYDRQHQDVRVERGIHYGDTPEHVAPAYLAGVAAVNAAALAHLASAPAPPDAARIVTAELGHDVLLRWTAPPDRDLAGYEVVWRETTSPVWTSARDVGAATDARLSLPKDDLLFGVRAYDRDGFRSPAAFARAAKQ